MNKYKSFSHAKTYLRYHIIFSTKYRRKCLKDISTSVIASFSYAEEKSNFKILDIGIDNDHIHLLLQIKPAYSIEQVVKRLKQITTSYLWKENKDYLEKFYWKNKIIWTNGYFCSTIGYNLEKTINNYILNQGNSNSYSKLKT